jgi:hypothetical protein
MSGPSNIKIQKTGAEEVGDAQVRVPASDLERCLTPSANLCTLGIPQTYCVR